MGGRPSFLLALCLALVLLLLVLPKAKSDYTTAKTRIKRTCAQLERLLRQEMAVQHILAQEEDKFRHHADLGPEERTRAVEALQLQRRQLEKSERLVKDTVKILEFSLQNITYLDVRHMKSTAQAMHKVLAASALEAQEISNDIDGFEARHLATATAAAAARQRQNVSSPHGAIEDVLHFLLRDIGVSVDRLEEQLHGHETQTFEKEKKTEGVQLETVVRVQSSDHPKAAAQNASDVAAAAPPAPPPLETAVTTLIDSKNNQYALRRPTDTTLHYEDTSLLNDIILLVGAAFCGGCLFTALRLPTFFGYIVTGVLLSPTGFNKIDNIVQVETLGNLGVFLILFLLGLEFSVARLKAVWRVAVLGGGALLVLHLALTASIVGLNGSPVSTGLLLGFCVCLSSTAIVMKCLDGQEASSPHGAALFGILILQDVALGVMLAGLPLLRAGPGSAWQVTQTLLRGLLIVAATAVLGARYVLPRLFARLRGSRELPPLGAISVMLGMVKLTYLCGLSMELGAFLAGLMISSHVDQAVRVIEPLEPIRDLFAKVFFVTMGLHIYPSFLLSEWGVLLTLTAAVVGLKYLSAVLLFAGHYKLDYAAASLIAVGLSSMSEFAYVLAAHGRRLEILSREMYFLLLGVTSLSFLSTPFLWRLSKLALPPRAYPDDHVSSDSSGPRGSPLGPPPFRATTRTIATAAPEAPGLGPPGTGRPWP